MPSTAPAAPVPPAAERDSSGLLRRIGLLAASAITVGNIVGSGIFRSPHSVAQQLEGLPLVLAAWVLGGVLSLAGSLVLVELAVLHPRSGGLYVFIREAFGDLWAFLFGWASLWVIKPTVIASIVTVFALYFCEALHLSAGLEPAVGVGAIVLLTLVNLLGVREGARTQTVFTVLKVVGIVGLCAAAFLLPHAGPPADTPLPPALVAPPLYAGFVAAMISVLFAYDGWTDATYVGGEIKDPRRNLPWAILGGTVAVIALYVLTNIAYYTVLTPAEVATIPAARRSRSARATTSRTDPMASASSCWERCADSRPSERPFVVASSSSCEATRCFTEPNAWIAICCSVSSRRRLSSSDTAYATAASRRAASSSRPTSIPRIVLGASV